jgi:hypothetical protein
LFDQEERPKDGMALDFVRKSLASPESDAAIAENAELRKVNQELQDRVKRIEDDIAALKKNLKESDGDNNENTNTKNDDGAKSPEILDEDPIVVDDESGDKD